MNALRVRTIIDKEWAEVFKNRFVLFTVAFLPLVFTALPIGMLYALRGTAMEAEAAEIPSAFLAVCGGAPPADCLRIFMVNQFMIMFMMMPLIIPISIAAYSVVGEKTTRSLEPLLATPLTTGELLMGKGLAAILPAVGATWVAFLIFLAGATIVGGGLPLLRYMTGPVWLLAVGIAGPLMSIVAVAFALMVSSRVNDPRAAEQISAVVIVPLLGLVFGQIAGVIVLNPTFMLVAITVLVVLSVALVAVAVRLFEREHILTKWK
jgi:ABC-2 type transport system permease protein